MIEVLETERLRLRRPTLDDATDIERLINVREIAEMTLSVPYPYPQGAAKSFLEEVALPDWDKDTAYFFAITRRADDELMGAIDIRPEQYERAEIGFWLGTPYWNQGYMTEAVRRVIQFGFEELKLNRIWAGHFTHNPASRRVQEKAGMTFEGVLRKHYRRGEAYIDNGVCGILREEWEAMHSSS